MTERVRCLSWLRDLRWLTHAGVKVVHVLGEVTYTESHWEAIDSESTDHFAVVFGEDYSIQPDAIFRSKEAADEYVEWQLGLPPSDDRYVPRDVTVLTLRDLKAVAWNSHDAVPDGEATTEPRADIYIDQIRDEQDRRVQFDDFTPAEQATLHDAIREAIREADKARRS